MHDVINKDLVFTNDADKRAWIKERSSWRLPYWDWADPNHDGNVPKLFMTPPNDISIRRPAAADGSLVDPEAVPNPLGRFQLKVKGVSTKMGDLPRPYRVDDVIHNGLVMPVSDLSR